MEVKRLLPREKADRYGISSLKDEELLALLVNTGNRKEDVMALSKRLLKENGGLKGVASCDKNALSIYGIKNAKAYRILACFEIEKRMPLVESKELNTLEEAIEVARKYFYCEEVETVLFFGLSRKHRLLKTMTFTNKVADAVMFDLEKVIVSFKSAFVRGVIVFHNHPSGQIQPSRKDLEELTLIRAQMKNEGLLLLDSVILGEKGNYFSFYQNHLL